MNCASCNHEIATRWEVRRFDREGTVKGEISVCSLVCLVQWSYDQAIRQGVRMAILTKGKIDSAKTTIFDIMNMFRRQAKPRG